MNNSEFNVCVFSFNETRSEVSALLKIFVLSLFAIAGYTGLMLMLAQPALAEENQNVQYASLTWSSPLVIVQVIWMILVTVGAALYSRTISVKKGNGVVNEGELRGLNLPRGSIRGILALATIGSFVNVMVLGAPVLGDAFENVLAAFGTLTGSIIGFYFGTRGATPSPDQ